jgi:hypothetical protein
LGVPVILDGVEYSAAEMAERDLSTLHYVSTYESIRDGYVFAFTSSEDSEQFRASYPVAKIKAELPREEALFPRTHSKFYDLTGYGD